MDTDNGTTLKRPRSDEESSSSASIRIPVSFNFNATPTLEDAISKRSKPNETITGAQNAQTEPSAGSSLSDFVFTPSLPPTNGNRDEQIECRSLHISPFKPETEQSVIVEHLKKYPAIVEFLGDLKCTKLVSRKRKLSSYGFISFKLDIPKHLFEIVTDSNIWPVELMVKEFEVKNATRVPSQNKTSHPQAPTARWNPFRSSNVRRLTNHQNRPVQRSNVQANRRPNARENVNAPQHSLCGNSFRPATPNRQNVRNPNNARPRCNKQCCQSNWRRDRR